MPCGAIGGGDGTAGPADEVVAGDSGVRGRRRLRYTGAETRAGVHVSRVRGEWGRIPRSAQRGAARHVLELHGRGHGPKLTAFLEPIKYQYISRKCPKSGVAGYHPRNADSLAMDPIRPRRARIMRPPARRRTIATPAAPQSRPSGHRAPLLLHPDAHPDPPQVVQHHPGGDLLRRRNEAGLLPPAHRGTSGDVRNGPTGHHSPPHRRCGRTPGLRVHIPRTERRK